MRKQNLLAGLLLAASAASADPILVTLEDAGSGGLGPLTFSFDMDRQGLPPHDYRDIADYEGDHVAKAGEYRINVADYFHVEMDGWIGYGYNWLLERSPRAFGIFEEYCQVQFFSSAGQTLILQGPWASSWSEAMPLAAWMETPQGSLQADMRIAALDQAVPEPLPAALFAAGLLALGVAARRPKPFRL